MHIFTYVYGHEEGGGATAGEAGVELPQHQPPPQQFRAAAVDFTAQSLPNDWSPTFILFFYFFLCLLIFCLLFWW